MSVLLPTSACIANDTYIGSLKVVHEREDLIDGILEICFSNIHAEESQIICSWPSHWLLLYN